MQEEPKFESWSFHIDYTITNTAQFSLVTLVSSLSDHENSSLSSFPTFYQQNKAFIKKKKNQDLRTWVIMHTFISGKGVTSHKKKKRKNRKKLKRSIGSHFYPARNLYSSLFVGRKKQRPRRTHEPSDQERAKKEKKKRKRKQVDWRCEFFY